MSNLDREIKSFNSEKDLERVKILQNLSGVNLGNLHSLVNTAVITGGHDLNCTEFVKCYLKAFNIEIAPQGIFKNGELVRNHKAFFHRMHQDYKKYRKTYNIKDSFSREEFVLEAEAILEDYWSDQKEKLKKEMAPIDDIKMFDKMLQELTVAISGKVYADHDSVHFRQAKAFIAHFFWQIMMRLHYGPKAVLTGGNQAVLMLVSSKQKTGKSTTVRYMLEVFEKYGFLWRATLDRLADQFSYSNLAYNYIAFFDDMHKSSQLNMGAFKQIVTQDEVHFRSMHSQTEMKLPQLATMIGTSNRSPRELMNDTTGLRRFHQILVNNGNIYNGEGIDLDTISEFNFQKFIRCVPLSKESPLFRYITPQELDNYEEAIRPKHIVEIWLREQGYGIGGEDADLMSLKDIYDSFKVWASRCGYAGKYMPNAYSMNTKMKELGYLPGRTNKFRGFYIKKGVKNG